MAFIDNTGSCVQMLLEFHTWQPSHGYPSWPNLPGADPLQVSIWLPPPMASLTVLNLQEARLFSKLELWDQEIAKAWIAQCLSPLFPLPLLSVVRMGVRMPPNDSSIQAPWGLLQPSLPYPSPLSNLPCRPPR